ncbi:hypothetical protein M9458_018769, partial [Cirrhinus mrigala]
EQPRRKLNSPSSRPRLCVHRTLGENVKSEPQSDQLSSCTNPNSSAPLTNGTTASNRSQQGSTANANSQTTVGKEDDPNEDWCAVCQNGGELLLPHDLPYPNTQIFSQ